MDVVRSPTTILCDMSADGMEFHLEKRKGQYYLRGGHGAFQAGGMTLADGNKHLNRYIEGLIERGDGDLLDQNGRSVVDSTRQFQGWMCELEVSLEQNRIIDSQIFPDCGGMLLSSRENKAHKLG